MSERLHTIQPYEPLYARPRITSPTMRDWSRHILLFLITAASMTLAGATLSIEELPEPPIPTPNSLAETLLYLPRYYLEATLLLITYVLSHPPILAQGAMFAGSLLAILTAHEAGHYFACRAYRVEASLPYFIPAPPFFLAGTFGAFIRIRSPIPSRRALFDIAVAGPLAGFIVAIPIAVIGTLIARPAQMQSFEPGTLIVFNDPLLLRALAQLIGIDLAKIEINPFYFAAWLGLLVTSLNLLPVGQLDGGHIIYALFGQRAHTTFGKAAFFVVLLLAILGWEWHGTPSGFVYAFLLLIILKLPHPPVMRDDDRLGPVRIMLALATAIIFALCFLPFPITIR
ncbi:site-2 protease family protein [Pyrinomonas methylaliphatogenes]|uniref:Predicted membrane-associated Zn-dependent protease n=1 Tax=Pyrinomonas methylaliphatogenes TaxID=454194 RepID=A0A0B6WUZ4_9BACT|nr:site-2 protease family protein [Pyrinomonas methylaliphatogenes]MBX5479226.1 site-2 protease family protein [Pyrinomonas methylaliphatogenes]CDM64064.1 predicted membrane-associated Zn-dependent protease [Pyrinomonas methylaliphatogenes]